MISLQRFPVWAVGVISGIYFGVVLCLTASKITTGSRQEGLVTAATLWNLFRASPLAKGDLMFNFAGAFSGLLTHRNRSDAHFMLNRPLQDDREVQNDDDYLWT